MCLVKCVSVQWHLVPYQRNESNIFLTQKIFIKETIAQIARLDFNLSVSTDLRSEIRPVPSLTIS